MHHRMGSYYESSISSCPSPIPSLSDGGPSFSSEASPNSNLFQTKSSSNGGYSQSNNLQYKTGALRNGTTSPLPPKVQPRKGILMSPSYPSQMSPPPPPPTSSIPRKGANLKNVSAMVGGSKGTSPIRQAMKRDQYYSTQPRSSSRDSSVILSHPPPPGRPFLPHPSLNHPLVRGRKVNSRDNKTFERQRLKFECDDMRQIHALNKRLASLTIADMSPKLALQRILILYKRGDHREAAGFIRRLSYATFRQLVEDLPMENFVEEAMPQSLPILEAIYGKIFFSGGRNFQNAFSNIKFGTQNEVKTTANIMNGMTNNLSNCSKYSPENVVWQIVKFFASQDSENRSNISNSQRSLSNDSSVTISSNSRWEMCGPWVSTCKRLLLILISTEPRVKRIIFERRKALTKAIEGLGQHGLVGTSDDDDYSLLHLHDALRLQFERVHKSYTEALSKLETLCLTSNASNSSADIISSNFPKIINGAGKLLLKKNQNNINIESSKTSNTTGGIAGAGGPPVAQSHQRQLSLRAFEIQERLIKNKSLLNAVEPVLENQCLEVLLGILQRRIELDKEVLFQFTQLKKETKLLDVVSQPGHSSSSTNQPSNYSDGKGKQVSMKTKHSNPSGQSVAPLLMRFQRGCQQVLDLMQEVSEDNQESMSCDISNQVVNTKPLISRKPTKYIADDKTKEFGGGHDEIINTRDNDENDDDDDEENLSYHSDSDSTVMMSGNSPFVSKAARYNFLSRSIRSSSRHNMLRPARSTGNLIDISSPPSSNDDRDDIKILNRRHNSPSIGSEKPKMDSMDHNLAGSRKFYPSNRSSKSYTSTVSSKIKKQNLHTNNNNVNALGSNINASNLIAITRNGLSSKLSYGCSSGSTSGVSSMTQSSESGSNEGSQNHSSAGSSATSSSAQTSTDSDSSGSGLGCEGSIGSDSPPCRSHLFNNKSNVMNGRSASHMIPSKSLTNSSPQVVVTRAVININPQEINNDKISISDDGFHGSSTISNDVNSSTSNGRQRKLETAIEDKGSDARKFVYSSESDPPLITIPRPNGTRGSSSGKYQSLDGHIYQGLKTNSKSRSEAHEDDEMIGSEYDLDDNEIDDLVFGETDQRKFRRPGNESKLSSRNQYSDQNIEDEELDEALLEKLRSQLERANQTIVSMRNKEKLLRTRLLEVEKRNCNLMNENNDNALLKGGGGESLLKTHLRFNANNNSNNNSNVQKGEIYNASNGIDKRPADLVRRFGDLYSMARLDTLDALDNVNELDQFFTSQSSSNSSVSSASSNHSSIIEGTSRTKSSSEELKNKLLFSVVVLSFRSAVNTAEKIREQIRRVLQLPPTRSNSQSSSSSFSTLSTMKNKKHVQLNTIKEDVEALDINTAIEVESSINTYLRRSSETFDLTKNYEEVCMQLWATLYDYPSLKTCNGLLKYIENCVRLSWGLVNQIPEYVIEYESRLFQSDVHVRFHTSNPNESAIKTYLWPALREGPNGPCVHKAVVIT